MSQNDGEAKIYTAIDMGNAARSSYDGLMERIAPLVKAIEDLVDLESGDRGDMLQGITNLEFALKEFKDPK